MFMAWLLPKAVQGEGTKSPHGLSARGQVEQGKQEGGGRSQVGAASSLSVSLFIASSVSGAQGCVPSRLQPALGEPGGLLSAASGPSTSYWSWAPGLRLCPEPEELCGLRVQASLLSRQFSQTCTRGWQSCHSPTGC